MVAFILRYWFCIKNEQDEEHVRHVKVSLNGFMVFDI